MSKTIKEPWFHLPVANEPLYLKHRPGEGPTYIKPKSKVMDEDRLILNKFKAAPTTKKERQECSSFLNPKQIMQIATNPSQMRFGPVCIQSDISKSFSISNGTMQNLMVRIELHGDKPLEKSTPTTQVVPAGATAGFDMTLYLEATIAVDTKFTYVINEHHSFDVGVTAEAVPVMLNMSREKIHFAFASSSNLMGAPEVLYLINPSNNLAEYKVESNANFVAFPSQGTVEPMSQEEVQITYKPAQHTAHEATLRIDVLGGQPMSLMCAGESDQGHLECKPRSIDFGSVAAGAAVRKAVTLTAKGDNVTVFFVDPDELKNRCPGLVVTPDKGMISPGGNVQILVSIKGNKPVKIDSYFIVQVRGGKNIKVPVKVDINVPTCTIKQEEIDFGSIYLGATGLVPLHIHNTSNIPAIFTLDLRKHPEFGVKIPEDLEHEDEDEQQLAAAEAHEASLPETALLGPRVMFCIPAKFEGKIELTYTPQIMGSSAFELPLSLLGIPSKDAKGLRRAVVGEASKPRLLLSTPSIDFEKRIVVNENMPNFNYALEMTLTNCNDQHCLVDARLEVDEATADVFKMKDTTAHLATGKSMTVRVLFIPRADGHFSANLRIYLDQNYKVPYFDLIVEGVGIYPSLGFDRREIFMPVTPVGQTSTICFEVINYGYDNLNVQLTLPADATTVPMTVKFPNGTMINVVNTRLPVEVSFSAKKSMSFATKIEFLDHNGNKYSIPILGTTDGSLLTVFPFTTLHSESIQIKGGERPPMLSIIGPIQPSVLNEDGEIEMQSLELDATHNGKMVNLLPPNSEFLCECKVLTERASVKVLLDWANISIFRQPVTQFPNDFLEARGKQVIDVIEASTGKTVPGQMKKVPGNRKEEGQMLLSQYTELLSTLKSYGGLVNCIKPEYLLPQDLFQKMYLEKGGLPVELRPFFHKHYLLIMEGSWMMLMYQVVKLFVLNRLTPKLLRSIPGVDPALTKGLYLTGSNVYSPSELVLLGWLTYHWQTTTPTAQILNFDKDLHDCRVFGAVIASHVPSLSAVMSTLKKTDVLAERIQNAHHVVKACRQIGFEYCPPATQLAQAPARDMMLFCIYLFNLLPSLIPRATIGFDGRLNDNVVKHIELTNPSGKTLVYTIRIDGSKEFRCADSLKIGARDKIKFPVNCFHKIRGLAKAQIFFIGERVAGGAAGVTLVFDLESSAKTFKRTEVIVKHTKLYDQIFFEIPVKNCDIEHETILNVSLVPLQPVAKGAVRSNSPKRGNGGSGASSKKTNVTSSALLPDMTFWTKVSTMKLKRKANNVIIINFVPLQFCGHSCLVFIKDDLVGETCYELQVKVDLPVQTDSNKFQHQMKSTVIKDVPVSARNAGIDKCRAGLMELMGANGKDWFKAACEQPHVEYKVEYLTDCFSGPKIFSLWGPNAQPKLSPAVGRPQPAMNNKLPLELRPQGPGKYDGRIILRSAFDIRVLDVEATVTAQGTRAELTFSCPARQAISQDIPIINHSDREWVIQSSLSGDYFSGPKEFKVPPMGAQGPGMAMYTLTFAPSWITNIAGELTLRNSTIGDSYVYELSGIGEDPVAEDHTQIECVARKRTSDVVLVRNILGSEDCEYVVECDLLGISGEATFFMKGDTQAEYDLSIMMPRGGEFTGSVSFKAPTGEYIWYTIQVKAENPAYERVIELNAKARTAIIADIPITNPLDETVTFDVLFEGEGLIGAPTITIEPGESKIYELVYSPLLADHSDGKLTFVNVEMGEFWYALHLDAAEADDIVIEPLEAELGKTVSVQLTAENPISDDILLEIGITNPLNFSVEYNPRPGSTYKEGVIEVEGYNEALFDIVFTPTAINEDEETKIVLKHPTAGRWVYHLKGRGKVLPNEAAPWDGKGVVLMPTVHVSSTVFQTSSNLLKFRNPLNRPLTLQLHVHQAPDDQAEANTRLEEDQPFRILLSQSTMHLTPFQEVDVPFLFCPTKMERHSALFEFEVVEIDHVALTQDTVFALVYGIAGTAEAPGAVDLGRFATRARERLDSALELPLSGVGPIAANEKIELEIIAPDEYKAMLAKSLAIRHDRANRDGLQEGIVRYNMSFEPLKAMRCRVLLKVSLESGGRWVFGIDLVANDAEVDDVIRIEGALNQTRSVSFRMTNQFNTTAAFNAYFAPESSAEFSVYPEVGLLEPHGTEGTNFVISFNPASYGKLYKGKLVVETDEMQWTYQVHGDHPKYQVPRNLKAKVDTQIQPELDPDVYKGRLTGHKYLRENLAMLKQQQKQNSERYAGGAN